MIKPFVVSLIAIASPFLIAQQPAASNPSAPQADQPAPAKGAVYTTLQPSMETVLSTLEGLKIDKWKKGSVRDEATQNVQTVLHDIQNHVPELVTAADNAPGSVSKAMPLVNHLDALYEVLLRVEEASRVAAPAEQIAQLQQALLKLNGARKALDDQLESQAAAEEKQIADLQASVKTLQAQLQPPKAIAVDTTTPCKPAAPAKKKKKAATAPAKSAAPAASTQKPQQ
jgi:hypothetical protein